MRRILALAILPASLLAAPPAIAATTRVVVPGAARTMNPCTRATPCKFDWAITHSASGDVVDMAHGEYDYPGGANPTITIPDGVTVHGSPGALRPLIKQTTAFSVSKATVAVGVGSALRDVAVDSPNDSNAPVDAGSDSIVERVVVTGQGGLFLEAATGSTGAIRDTLIVTSGGTALEAVGDKVYHLENVTAIAHGPFGDALFADATSGIPTAIDAVNTIARGDRYDVKAEGTAAATVTVHNSNYRDSPHTHVSGMGSIGGTNIHHDDPLFVSPTDFHEKQASPTIDVGTTAGLTGSLDLDGRPRSVGAAPDIGAYEFVPPPAVVTGAASALGATAATIAGTVNPAGSATTYRFQYGKTTAYGASTPAAGAGSGHATTAVGATLTGLGPATTYHYRLVGTSSGGTVNGADRTFTTAALLVAIGKKAKVRKGKAIVKLTCPPASSGLCSGTLFLTRKKGQKQKAVGSTPFSIAPGKTAKAKVKLPVAVKQALANGKTVKVTARAVAADGSARKRKLKLKL